MLVLDANEALDVHLDAEAAALAGARAAQAIAREQAPKPGRRR
jgi:hypothetical protein